MLDNKRVAIIGMGPSGVSAAIYLKRYGMEPICFEKENVGGKLTKTDKIENYPGVISIKGTQLAFTLEDQLNDFNIKVNYSFVSSLEMNPDSSFHIKYGKKEDDFKYVIIANGLKEKDFHIENDERFLGRGISRCAICDGPFYKDKNVVVIGGGNSAFEEAIYLASVAKEVTVLSHHNNLKADKGVVEKYEALSNATLLKPYDAIRCNGEKNLESLTVRNNETQKEEELKTDGIFIYVGESPMIDFVKIEGIVDEKNYFVTDDKMMTKVNNLYAIGDCRNSLLRQVVSAVNDGAIAASFIHQDYQKHE